MTSFEVLKNTENIYMARANAIKNTKQNHAFCNNQYNQEHETIIKQSNKIIKRIKPTHIGNIDFIIPCFRRELE